MPKKLIVIDGHSLLHRGFHAVPNLSTSTGEPTGAVFGFALLFLKVLKDLQPDAVVVAFDLPEPTFRHRMYAQYKAQRPEMDAVLAKQIPRVKELVAHFYVPILELSGFEADDILGTVITQVEQNHPEYDSYIVTGDKDTFQLISEKTFVYTMKRGLTDTTLYTKEAFFQRYNFEPSYFIDYKGLVGDPSDNIPGVKGIGEKTASTVIQEFQTLENLYEHFDEILLSDRVKNLLREGKEMAFFSRELATIVCNVPMQFSMESALFSETYDREYVISLFKTLEFNSLISKLPPKKQSSATVMVVHKTEDDIYKNCSYTAIDDDKSFFAFLELLCAQKEFAFDTETTSEKPLEAELVGISFCWKNGEAFYCNVRNNDVIRLGWLQHLKPLFEDESIAKYGHNLKYDASVLENYGIHANPLSFDTMLAAYLLHPGDPVGLKSLALSAVEMQLDSIETFIGSGKEQKSFATVPLKNASRYACADADATWRLVQLLRGQLSQA